MSKSIFLILSLFAMCYKSEAQIFQWANYIGGMPDNNDYSSEPGGKVSTVDAFGYIYVTADAGYLKKFDLAGNLIWSVNTGKNGYSIAADTFGYIYIIGKTVDAFIEKRDSSGGFVWSKTLQGADYGIDIKVDGEANIYTVGHFTDSTDFDPGIGMHMADTGGAFLLKLDSAGSFQWVFTENEIFTNTEYYNALTLDNYGNIYVAAVGGHGAFWGGHLIKINVNGQLVWERNYPGTQVDHGSDILDVKVTDSNFVYTTGLIKFKVGFQGELFVNKMDTSGGEIWINEFTGAFYSYEASVDIGPDGSVYAIGSSMGGYIVDDGIPHHTYGAPNMYLLRLDPNGNTVWSFYHYVPLSSLHTSHGYNIKVMNNCDLLLTGVIQGNFDMYPGPYTYMQQGSGLFLQKLMCNSTGADETNIIEKQIDIYPNPSAGNLFISSPTVITSLQIFDVVGRLVHSSHPDRTLCEVSISASPGIYQVIIYSGEGKVVKKLVVE